jgi:hypothetical protein
MELALPRNVLSALAIDVSHNPSPMFLIEPPMPTMPAVTFHQRLQPVSVRDTIGVRIGNEFARRLFEAYLPGSSDRAIVLVNDFYRESSRLRHRIIFGVSIDYNNLLRFQGLF